MKKLFYMLGIILFGLFLVWYFLIKPRIEASLYTKLVKVAPGLKQEDLSIFPIGLSVGTKMDSMFGNFPISLMNPRLQLNTFSLLTLSPALNFSAGVLNGEMNAAINSNRSFDKYSSKFAIKQAQLAEHPIIKLCGLSTGTLDFEASADGTKQNAIPNLKFNLKAQDLEVPARQKLPSFISKFPVSIPAISGGMLNIRGSCSDNQCKSDTLEFISSLGEIKGSSVISNLSANPQINLTLDFALTKSGREQILPLLSILNHKIMETPEQPVSLKMRGPLNSAIVSVVARQ